MIGWSPIYWLAAQLGCRPDEVTLIELIEAGHTATARYRAPRVPEVTVLATLAGDIRRLTFRKGDVQVVAKVHPGRVIAW